MPKAIVIIRSSFLTGYDNVKMIKAMERIGFDFGMGRWKLFWHISALQNLATQFNVGNLTPSAFYQSIMEYFPEMSQSVNETQFFEAWNQGFQIQSGYRNGIFYNTFKEIDNVFKSAKHFGMEIIITGNTNRTHMDYISEKLKPETREKWKEGVFSYDVRSLDVGRIAIERASDAQHLTPKMDDADESSVSHKVYVMLKEPSISGLDKINPLALYFHYRAVDAYERFKRLAAEHGAECLDWQPYYPNLMMKEISDKVDESASAQAERYVLNSPRGTNPPVRYAINDEEDAAISAQPVAGQVPLSVKSSRYTNG